MIKPHPILLLGLTLSGCGGLADNAFNALDTGDYGASSTSTQDSATTTLREPNWYRVVGSLEVRGGELSPDDTALQVEYFVDAEPAPACTYTLPLQGAVSTELNDPDLEMSGWWSLSFDEATLAQGSCKTSPPSRLELGLGPQDARLEAQATAHGLTEATAYGLYLREAPPDPLFVVGLAGTEEQLSGSESAPEGPLADGTYTLSPLVLMPL